MQISNTTDTAQTTKSVNAWTGHAKACDSAVVSFIMASHMAVADCSRNNGISGMDILPASLLDQTYDEVYKRTSHRESAHDVTSSQARTEPSSKATGTAVIETSYILVSGFPKVCLLSAFSGVGPYIVSIASGVRRRETY